MRETAGELRFGSMQAQSGKTTASEPQDLARPLRMSGELGNGRRQITVTGLMAYTVLWGLVLGLFRLAISLVQGVHTIAENQLSQLLILIATGLLFVAIGLPITFLAGGKRQAFPISVGCFFVGLLAIPCLVVISWILLALGVITLE